MAKEARNSFFRRFERTDICGFEGTDRLIYIWMLNGHRMQDQVSALGVIGRFSGDSTLTNVRHLELSYLYIVRPISQEREREFREREDLRTLAKFTVY